MRDFTEKLKKTEKMWDFTEKVQNRERKIVRFHGKITKKPKNRMWDFTEKLQKKRFKEAWYFWDFT